MIVTTTSEERNVIVTFLTEARQLRLGKKQAALLARLRDDFRRNEVNSQRLLHARPLLKQLHTYCLNVVVQSFRYRLIPRWQRVLVVPAVLTFLFRVLPKRLKFEARLALVAKHVNDVVARSEGKVSTKG